MLRRDCRATVLRKDAEKQPLPTRQALSHLLYRGKESLCVKP
jgi:hypothetical protein